MPYDQRPPSRKTIEIAADLLRRGEAEAAVVIRDLIDLAKAQSIKHWTRSSGYVGGLSDDR